MSPRTIAGAADSGLLIIVDHASNHVPADIALGIDPALLDQHMAIDIGTEELCGQLADRLSASALLATVSRLVIDLNRDEDAPGLIPQASDGHAIPGNADLSDADRADRIDRFWRPYHAAIERTQAEMGPVMLVSLHSFTPRLTSDPEQQRPWQIGVLYNQDDRAARVAIPLLEAAGVVTGDNLPYSGKVLNATMNRHGEGRGIAYLGLEVRQDLIADAAGIARWGAILASVIASTRDRLA
jgi:predicted N-formylglutamate amidohydrolase